LRRVYQDKSACWRCRLDLERQHRSIQQDHIAGKMSMIIKFFGRFKWLGYIIVIVAGVFLWQESTTRAAFHRRTICVRNLNQISVICGAYRMDKGIPDNTTVDVERVAIFDPTITNFLACPDGGQYTLIGHSGSIPACSITNASWPSLLARLRGAASFQHSIGLGPGR
jgi:hypothetical protein